MSWCWPAKISMLPEPDEVTVTVATPLMPSALARTVSVGVPLDGAFDGARLGDHPHARLPFDDGDHALANEVVTVHTHHPDARALHHGMIMGSPRKAKQRRNC